MGSLMPNDQTLQPPARPVLLTGYDLELQCPNCGVVQIFADDSDWNPRNDEFVALHALPGRYLLHYRVKCWTCDEPFSGRVSIRSRATGQ
jgi:hypothetical protein